MKNVFELEPTTNISRDDSYIVSYPHILAHFQSFNDFSQKDFVCGVHIVYGWMPTILDLNPSKLPVNFQHGAEILNEAKKNGQLSDCHLEVLAQLVNNSLVGASKLLHFVAPNSFAIWDSKIYKFVFNQAAHNYRVNQIGKYREYLSELERIRKHSSFSAFHNSVNAKVGYEVSALRAIELVMFINSGQPAAQADRRYAAPAELFVGQLKYNEEAGT